MPKSEQERAEKRRLDSQRQKEKRTQDRICGWCESPENVELIYWYGKPPKEGEKPKKPLEIPICKECLARLDARWPHGTGLCGYCEKPTNNIIDWRGPSGALGIVMCEGCLAQLNGSWRPEGNVCGYCAMPANEQIEWNGIPYPLPICSDCKTRLIGNVRQGDEPVWRRLYLWLMGK